MLINVHVYIIYIHVYTLSLSFHAKHEFYLNEAEVSSRKVAGQSLAADSC